MEDKGRAEAVLTKKEKDYYEFLFGRYSTSEAAGKVVSSANIKALFQTSGLAMKELSSIWNITAEKKKSHLDQKGFNLALKLVALRQDGKSLDNYASDCAQELPLPAFNIEDVRLFLSQLEESKQDKPTDDILVQIANTEYVKSGVFGMSSYTLYTIETKGRVSGFDPKKTYVVYRRFSDFDWLHKKLQSEEKYKGCVFPILPTKKLLGKNSEEFVEKRKQELQLYLQILGRDKLFNTDPTYKLFLTSTDDDFERYKNDPASFSNESSIAVSSLRKFQFKDTFNYLYSSLKNKFFDSSEPEEVQIGIDLESFMQKIGKYSPYLDKRVQMLEGRLCYLKSSIQGNEDMIVLVEGMPEEDAEMAKVQKSVQVFHRGQIALLKSCMQLDQILLNSVKEEKLKLEGIKQTVGERKSQIELFKSLSEYASSKSVAGQGPGGSTEEVEKLKVEIERTKERVAKFNNNLLLEFESFPKFRSANLQKIMSCACFVEKEKAGRILDFSSDQCKSFPAFEPAEPSTIIDFKPLEDVDDEIYEELE